MNSEAVLGLANYEVTSIEHSGGEARISASYLGSVACQFAVDKVRRKAGSRQSCDSFHADRL